MLTVDLRILYFDILRIRYWHALWRINIVADRREGVVQ